MLLLVVDGPLALSKKEFYSQNLNFHGVLHASTIHEAQEIIIKDSHVDLLLINNVLIENIKYELDELKKLSDCFSGDIIVKVDEEIEGIKLLKEKLITDYYLSDEDENTEFLNLKKIIKITSIRRRISKNIAEATKTVEELARKATGV